MSVPFLADLRVVEIAHPGTEYAGKILAEMGAEVFLVEAPEGAATRRRAPFAEVADRSRASVPFLARNGGKRSAVFDPGSAEDRAAFERLLAAADVLLNPPDSLFAPWLSDATPDLVRVNLHDPEGVGAASVVAFAASGGLASSGWPEQPPCNAPSWLAHDAAGIYLAVLAVLGFRALRAGAEAPVYDISLREAAIAGVTPWTRPLHSYGHEASGQGSVSRRLGPTGQPIFRCSDGYVRALMGVPRQWEAFINLLGRPDEFCTEDWASALYRRDNADALLLLGTKHTRGRRRADLFESGQELGLTITPVYQPADVMTDRHVQARENFVEIQDPDLGAVKALREPLRHNLEVPSQPPSLGPARGAETAAAKAVQRRAGRPQTPITGTAERPLKGLRVLNLGVGAVVPEAAELLALLGAEVIKVESRRRVDFLRSLNTNDSAPFNQLNLGVLSLGVDMSTEAGREAVRRLVPLCDIVMENMRAAVVRGWGFDYESVRALRPDVIYFSSQGLGRGPYGEFQTYGPNLQAFSGITASWAHPDDPYPVGTTLNHPDHVAGKQALLPILAALMRREATGEGAFIEGAQYEVACEFIADKFLQEQLFPGTTAPLGNRSLDFAPHGVYATAGENRWCAIAVTSEAEWAALRSAIGEEWVQDPAFATMAERLANADRLDQLLGAWTQRRPAEDVEAVLRSAGVPASRAVTGDDMAANTGDHESGFFQAVDHPTSGTHWFTGLPFTINGKRLPVRRAPLLGEHTQRVLYDLLGLPAGEVSRLIACGTVGH